MTLAPTHPLHESLRPYQAEVIDSTWAHLADGARRGLIVMPTGVGKTRTALGWWGQHRRRTLWLAHRIELVEQARVACRALYPDARITRADATVWDLSGDLVVGQVQTCATPKRLVALANSGEWDAVIVDEAHHTHHKKESASGKEPKPVKCQYTDIVTALNGSPFVLGLTATPDRLDKRSVVGWFDDRIIASLDIRWAIEHGYLVPIRALTVRTDVDLDSVKTSHGDFAAGDLGRALSAADAPATGVAAWLEHASDRITLAFAPTIESSIEITDAFRAAGVAAAHLDGKTPDDERRRLIRDLGTGALRVLVNVGVTTEGTDIPAVSCVAMWRPTTSRALAVQMTGRGLRLSPDKQDCLVIDLVGTSKKHSLVLASDVLGLHRQLGQLENSLDAIVEERELFEAAAVAEQLACEAEWADPDAVIFGESDPLAPRRDVRARHTWQHAPVPGALRRWTCTRAAETVVLRPHPDGTRTWVAGIGTTVATAVIIASGPRLSDVIVNAERWIDGNRPEGAWRKDPITHKQRLALLGLGHPAEQIAGLTKAQAGRLIGIGKAARSRRQLDEIRTANAWYAALDRVNPAMVADVTRHGTVDADSTGLAVICDRAGIDWDRATPNQRNELVLRIRRTADVLTTSDRRTA